MAIHYFDGYSRVHKSRDVDDGTVRRLIRIPFNRVRTALVRKGVRHLSAHCQPFLSSDEVNTARRQALREVVARINDTYAT